MTSHTTGTPEEHLAARLELLEAGKKLTRKTDQLARRQLPWGPVEKDYLFGTDEGDTTLRGLFDGRSQLLACHFMFGSGWTEGCPGCSSWADGFDGTIAHLNARDVTMVCTSRAPLLTPNAYEQRMGWSCHFVSSGRCDFNYDYGVSFRELDAGASQPDTRPTTCRAGRGLRRRPGTATRSGEQSCTFKSCGAVDSSAAQPSRG